MMAFNLWLYTLGIKINSLRCFQRNTVAFIVLFGALSLSHAQDLVTAEKKDGKFHTTIFPINAYGFAGGDEKSVGFIESTELDITWWWLFREPVYYHTLRWKLKDAIKVELYYGYSIFLHRRALKLYPDLLARYDDLQPLHMEITVDVTLRAMSIIKPISGYGTFFEGGQFTYRRVIKDVELMVVRSGGDGENMSSGTPPDGFREFTSYAVKPGFGQGYGLSKKEVEKKLAATFINTGTVEFRNALISEIQIPEKEIKSIYDTLMYRENGCREYTDNPLTWTCKKKDVGSEKTPVTETASDFWNNGGIVESESQVGIKTKAETEEIKPQITDSDNFWNDGGQVASKSNDTFWQGGSQGETQSNEAEKFKIETRGRTQGVVSLSGEILIPFKAWEIKSYKGGIALASETERDSSTCEVDVVPRALQWSFSAEGWAYSASAITEGYVGKEGTWLTPPQKTLSAPNIRIRGYKHEPYMQVRQDYYERTYPEKYDRFLRRHNKKMNNCKAEISDKRQSFLSKYKSEGYQLK
ncbi:hypothetical protein, partial [Psychromonas sp. MB-3u-54]|uniref:hypothetical protein n=1 Tax=Psychromonas sp. MB-3u-54 TaxID=2058319 RepID=UPI0012FEF751